MKNILKYFLICLFFQTVLAQQNVPENFSFKTDSGLTITYGSELRYSYCWWNYVCDTFKNDFKSKDEIDKFATDFLHQGEERAYRYIREFAEIYDANSNKEQLQALGEKIKEILTPVIVRAEYDMTIGKVQIVNIGEFVYSTRKAGKPPELTSIEGAESFQQIMEVKVLDTSENLVAVARVEDDPIRSIEKLFSKYAVYSAWDSKVWTCSARKINETEYQLLQEKTQPGIIEAGSGFVKYTAYPLERFIHALTLSACRRNSQVFEQDFEGEGFCKGAMNTLSIDFLCRENIYIL